MKILAVCGVIRLPDDFDGSLADAWALYGDHVVGGSIENSCVKSKQELAAEGERETRSGAGFFARRAINRIIDKIRKDDGPKHQSFVTFTEMQADGTWVPLDVNQNRRQLRVVRG